VALINTNSLICQDSFKVFVFNWAPGYSHPLVCFLLIFSGCHYDFCVANQQIHSVNPFLGPSSSPVCVCMPTHLRGEHQWHLVTIAPFGLLFCYFPLLITTLISSYKALKDSSRATSQLCTRCVLQTLQRKDGSRGGL
jgi:hypothetical protein